MPGARVLVVLTILGRIFNFWGLENWNLNPVFQTGLITYLSAHIVCRNIGFLAEPKWTQWKEEDVVLAEQIALFMQNLDKYALPAVTWEYILCS